MQTPEVVLESKKTDEKIEQLKSELASIKKNFQENLDESLRTNMKIQQETESLKSQLALTNSNFTKLQKNQEDSSHQPSSKNHSSPSQKSSVIDEESEILKKLRQHSESLDFRLETLRYDVDSLKDNMVRQRRNQGEFLNRVSNMENKIESLSLRDTLGSRSTYSNSRQQNNFMSNNSMASNMSEANHRLNRFSAGQDYGQPLQALLDKDDDDEDYEENYTSQQNQGPPIIQTTAQNYSSVQISNNVQQVRVQAMTPQPTNNVDLKSGKISSQFGMENDDPSFLKKFGSNLTGNPPVDEEFDPNLSVIKETDQSNLIEPSEFNNFYFEGRDSLRNSIKGNQTQSIPKTTSNPVSVPIQRVPTKAEYTASQNSSSHSSSLKIPDQKTASDKVSLSDSLKNILNQNLQNYDPLQTSSYTTPKLAEFQESNMGKNDTKQPQQNSPGIRNINLSPVIEEQNSVLSNIDPYNAGKEITVKVPELRSEHLDKQPQLNLTNNMNTSFKIKPSVLNMSLQNINPNRSMALDTDNDETVTLQVDDNGFLLDKEGYPILGDDGIPIKLTDENIEFFKENNLYVEEEVNPSN